MTKPLGRGAFLAAALAASMTAHAAEPGPVKVGVLTDMSGFLSSSLGSGSVDAARMAVEDFGGEVLGKKIELVFADHQNKPDVGLAIARKWYDADGVDVIADVGNSAVGLGVQDLARSKKKLVMFSGATSSVLTNEACSPYGTQWSHDSYVFASAVPGRLVRQGYKTWFIVAVDYAFGKAMEADMTKVIAASGGNVVGKVRHPAGTPDLSSFALQAMASKASAVGLANAVTDAQNFVRQWKEYGGGKGEQRLVAPLLINDVRALGLEAAQGTMVPSVFYWDLDDKTRVFSKRFLERNKTMPSALHAGIYSAVSHYLKAVKAAGTKDSDAVRVKMRELPINDFFSENVRIREDGRVMRNSYVARVKAPSASKGEWDMFEILEKVPADQTWIPLSESKCPLVQKGAK